MTISRHNYRVQKDIPFHFEIDRSGRHSASAILVHNTRYAQIISRHCDSMTCLGIHSQFEIHEAVYRGRTVLIGVTGIGPLATSIMVHELIGLGVDSFCKLGSVGGISDTMRVGDFVIPTGFVREDGTSEGYVSLNYPSVPSNEIQTRLGASLDAARHTYHRGMILTKNSYYSSLSIADYDYWRDRGVLGIELECAPIFVIVSLKEKKAGALLVCNRSYEQIAEMKSSPSVRWKDDIDSQLGDAVASCLESVIDFPSE